MKHNQRFFVRTGGFLTVLAVRLTILLLGVMFPSIAEARAADENKTFGMPTTLSPHLFGTFISCKVPIPVLLLLENAIGSRHDATHNTSH